MWHGVDIDYNNYLYYESTCINNGKEEFIFLTENEKTFKITVNAVYSFRAVNDMLYLSNCDKYMTKSDIDTLKNFWICYTLQSDYLDWFNRINIGTTNTSVLYHFFVKSENYIIEFISDEMPLFEII